jgi:hypothetical protein
MILQRLGPRASPYLGRVFGLLSRGLTPFMILGIIRDIMRTYKSITTTTVNGVQMPRRKGGSGYGWLIKKDIQRNRKQARQFKAGGGFGWVIGKDMKRKGFAPVASGRPVKRRRKAKYARPAERTTYQKMRHKWSSKVSGLRRKGVAMEADYLGSGTAAVVGVAPNQRAGTLYLGHYTHPAIQTIRALCMAWAKFIAIRTSGHVPGNLDELIGGPQAGTKGDFNIEITYKKVPESETLDTYSLSVVGLTETTKSLCDKLIAALYAIQDNEQFLGVGSPELTLHSFLVDPKSDNIRQWRYDFKDLTVTIQGSSSLKMCNISTASDIGAPGDDIHSKDHILHVPLQCRAYSGKGSLFQMRNMQYGTGNSDGHIKFANRTGLEEFDDADASLSAAAQAVLKYPPRHAVWYGAKAEGRGFMLDPGKFTTSYQKATHTLKFNQWIKILRVELAQSGTVDHENHKTSIGKAKWFGFHKKFEHSITGVTPAPVSVDYELHLKFVSLMTYKKKAGFTATDPVLT